MKTVKTKTSLDDTLQEFRNRGMRIAFVPTMGALHQGHLALVERARELAEIVVCSIFVNPTQFNDPGDLANYPRTLEKDTALLKSVGCDVLFHPAVEEMYGDDVKWHLDLGHLDEVLEARHRPGHFQGVTQIVKKLFDAVKPDIACFGQKDFQQFKVVSYMVDKLGLPLTLEMCPTIREPDGLAMSSRNARLSAAGRHQALALYRTLRQLHANFGTKNLDALREAASHHLAHSPGVQPEYIEIYDTDTFQPAGNTTHHRSLVALVAAWVAGVRLIDNVILTPR